MRNLTASFVASLLLMGVTNISNASTSAVPLADVDFERSPAAYQRGFKVANEVCRLCHSFKYIKYSNLMDIGLSEAQIDTLRGDETIGSSLKAFMSDENADQAFGMIPPDLSVMAKARKGGPNYIYTLLSTYERDDKGVIENHLFPGIKMPDVMSWSIYTDAADREAIATNLKDVGSFLAWTADPHEDTRRAMGTWVIGYLVLLTFLLWIIKKRIWGRLPPPQD